jgi:tritrans,polycis-undecaprenyl-diphosphate synthase [geranylgeranyl-diphosphate specific]
MLKSEGKIPKHVGIIMDGNRRFAKRLMMKPWKGHQWGAEKVRKVLDWAHEAGIKELTLYAFSIENFDRPKDEFDYLMDLFLKEFKSLMEPEELAKLKENEVKVNFIGRIEMFPEAVTQAMNDLMDATKDNGDNIVNFAMAYGGRAEVLDAAKKIAERVKSGELDPSDINEEVFEKGLYTESEPDLIIRTSGEQRTSGFMIWQGSYAELFFTDKCWPEFEKEDLEKAIVAYQGRERRFGK